MNVGMGWIGDSKRFSSTTTITVHPGDVLIRKARPFHSGVEGMSDLIGFHSITVTPEMVGRKVAVFTALEVKTPTGPVRSKQIPFRDNVLRFGGFAGIVRSEDDVEKVLTAAST